MNILRIICANPRCQKILRINARQAGKRIRCPTCGVALIAPTLPPGMAPAADEDDGGDDALDAPAPLWMTALFWLLFLAGFAVLIAAAIGFEVWYHLDSQPVAEGATADLLTDGPWKVVQTKERKTTSEDPPAPPAWYAKNYVWYFAANGNAETGKVREDISRFDRKPASGFRAWTWELDGNKLTLTQAVGVRSWSWNADSEQLTVKVEPQPSAAFTVAKVKAGKKEHLVLTPARETDPVLVFERCDPLRTRPEWRTVFYGGVLAPILFVCLLAWLISREIFYAGCLRFALGWPLTVILGLALGAGAGFLLDVINDHSHGAAPYWMLVAFLQGVLSVFTGFYLAILSCLRPT
jgi:hypothetical protein